MLEESLHEFSRESCSCHPVANYRFNSGYLISRTLMASEPCTVNTILPAAIGLAGVVIGSLIGVAKDWLLSGSKKKKDMEYLAARVVTVLDEFAECCASVAGDNGTSYGQQDEQGCYSPQVEPPEISFHDLEVAWTALPGYLLYEIMNFPNEVAAVKRYLNNVAELADPPYGDYMEERQYEYAKLGVKADHFASKLRTVAGFPSKEAYKWDPVTYMEGQIRMIDKRNRDRELADEIRQQLAQGIATVS